MPYEQGGEDKPRPVVAVCAGALAGVLADGLLHPMDTLRARLQTQRGYAIEYQGVVDAMRKTVAKESWRALYGGFGIDLEANLPDARAVATFTMPAHALYFGGYETSKAFLGKPGEVDAPWVHFASGFAADIAGAFVWTPMDVVKQRLQVQRKTGQVRYRGSAHALRTIVKEEGFMTLYKGFNAAILTYGPYIGLYFLCYEQTKSYFSSFLKRPRSELPLWTQILGGGASAALASAITNPVDVIKTRIQVESKLSAGAYTGILNAAQRIIAEEGVKTFWRGLNARVLWMAPNSAVTIAAYEQSLRFVRNVFNDTMDKR